MALCRATKHEGIPIQILINALFGGVRRPIEFVGKVNNSQVISLVHKGCSKKLQFFEKTHKCSLGSMHERMQSGQLVVVYSQTLTNRGDGFTKCFSPPSKFIEARKMMPMVLSGRVAV